LVPFLCDYQGIAIFMDADMLARADLTELTQIAFNDYSVKVVKSIERFEWPSLMLFNNQACRTLTPEFIETENPYKLKWGTVGELPSEWNHVVGYSPRRPDAKVVHFTMGIPCWEETKDCEYADEWRKEFDIMNSSVSFNALMGQSRHDVARLRA
jgi:hypothetical protein